MHSDLPATLPSSGSPAHRILSGVGQATAFAVLTVVLWWLCAWLIHDQPWIENELILSVLSLAPAVCLSTAFFLFLGPRQSWDDVGLPCTPESLWEVGVGILGGASIALSIVGTLWLLGWIVVAEREAVNTASISRTVWEPGWGYAALILLVGSASEELLFRGYALQQFIRASNAWVAVIGTSVLFGLLHAGNPGASNVGLVNTALFGCLFGLLLVRTRSLGVPIGVHFGWNFTLVTTGVNLSGIRIKLADVMLTSSGPALWSGGDYGPEASLITALVILVVIGVVLYFPPRLNTRPRLWD